MLGAFWDWSYSGSPWPLLLALAFFTWPFVFVVGAIWGSRREEERQELRRELRRAARLD